MEARHVNFSQHHDVMWTISKCEDSSNSTAGFSAAACGFQCLVWVFGFSSPCLTSGKIIEHLNQISSFSQFLIVQYIE